MPPLTRRPLAPLLAVFAFVSFMECTSATRPPNVIIIYSDDHGYTDLGLFGIDSNVDTPNMDALARGGALMRSAVWFIN